MNSIQKTARLTGFLYFLLMPLGVFGILYVPETLIVPGDIATTASNILANGLLFRLSIVSAILVQLINIFVVMFLYKILSPVNRNYAVLMAVFILLGVPIAYLNEVTHFAVLFLLSGSDYLAVFTTEQLQAMVALMFDLHESGIMIAQIFWGLWLFPMGYLVFRSGFMPRMIGIFLMIGCFGYLIDCVIYFLFPTLGMNFSQFTFVGELMITLWLLIMGVNVERWEKRALASA